MFYHMNTKQKPTIPKEAKQIYQTQKSVFFWMILSGVPNAFYFIFPNWEIASVLISYLLFPILVIFLWQSLFRDTPAKDIKISSMLINRSLLILYFLIAWYFTMTWIAYSFAKQECLKGEHWNNIRKCLQEAEQNRFTTFR